MFETGNTLRNVKLPPEGAQNLAKTGFVFARRTLSETKQIILPVGGEEYPSPYIPLKLGSYSNGPSALSALAKKGFKFKLGGTATQSLSAPDLISANTINGTVDLIWNNATTGLESLGSNIVGSVTQVTSNASATIKALTVKDAVTVLTVVMVNGSAQFNSVNIITVTAVLPFAVPNPNLSDEVCVFAYWYYQKRIASPNFTTSPDLWISVLINGVNTSISPPSEPILLVAPTAVTLLSDGSYNLEYAATAANLGLLPTVFFGNSIVTQVVSVGEEVTGALNGLKIVGTSAIINVSNPTGAFVATAAISIQLDIARNGGTLTGKTEIGGFAMCFPVSSQAELLANHSDFMGLITSLREPSQVQNNKFNVIGYYSFMPEYIGQHPLSYYTNPDTDAYCFTLKMDIPTPLQPPCNNVTALAQSLYTDMMNEPPYEADAGEGAIVNMPISTNKASQINGEQCEQLTTQGCTTLAYTEANTGYWYQRVCTLQTISETQDNEERYMAFQEKVRWLDKNIELANRRATIDSGTGQRKNNNPETVISVKVGGERVLSTGVDLGVLGVLGNSVEAVLGSDGNVTKIKQTITTSIVPQNNGVDTVVYIKSYEV